MLCFWPKLKVRAQDIKNIFKNNDSHEAYENLNLYISNLRGGANKKNKLYNKLRYFSVSYSSLYYYDYLEKFINESRRDFSYYVDFKTTGINDLRKDFHVGRYIWGDFNEKTPYQRASEYPIYMNSEKGLGLGVLTAGQVTKLNHNIKEHIALFHYGIVMSNLKLNKGFFFFEVTQLPSVPGFFPAIWIVSNKSWPPEVDLMEQKILPCGGKFLRVMEHNVYYEKEKLSDNAKSLGSVSAINRPINNKLYFGCYIGEYEIAIYYGNDLVRIVQSEKIMSYFNNMKGEIEIILNNAILENQMHLAYANINKNIDNTKMYVSRFAYVDITQL